MAEYATLHIKCARFPAIIHGNGGCDDEVEFGIVELTESLANPAITRRVDLEQSQIISIGEPDNGYLPITVKTKGEVEKLYQAVP